MTQSLPRPVSTWSESICKKIPERHWASCYFSALWILRNPIRLTKLEKEEVLAVIDNYKRKNELNNHCANCTGTGYIEYENIPGHDCPVCNGSGRQE